MTLKEAKKRIEDLEHEVRELRSQLTQLALRPPIVVPVSTPAIPSGPSSDPLAVPMIPAPSPTTWPMWPNGTIICYSESNRAHSVAN